MNESAPPPAAILRPVRSDDAAAVWALLEPATAELLGMTALPKSSEAAEQACEESMAMLADLAAGTFELGEGDQASMLFVLVDSGSPDAVLGLTGMTIKERVPNLAVRVVTSRDGLGLDMASSSTPWTRTELNSSFMAPQARGHGLGGLLSRGRLMFLHQVQRQAPPTVASHIRGRFDDDGTAPFWRCFGSHFLPDWPDSRVAEEALAADPTRLDELIGLRRPVTADVLDSLGPVNRASLPAFRVLMREGLRPNGMYDPIDGGPTLVADRANTTSGRRRRRGRVRSRSGPGGQDALVAVTAVDDFRVGRFTVDLTEPDTVGVDRRDADALRVEPGTLLAFSPLGKPPTPDPTPSPPDEPEAGS